MSFFQKAADIAHKGALLGIGSLFVVQMYQIIDKTVFEGVAKNEHPQSEYIEALREKTDEAYSNYHKIDHRDWYDKNDNSYLKDAAPIPRLGATNIEPK